MFLRPAVSKVWATLTVIVTCALASSAAAQPAVPQHVPTVVAPASASAAKRRNQANHVPTVVAPAAKKPPASQPATQASSGTEIPHPSAAAGAPAKPPERPAGRATAAPTPTLSAKPKGGFRGSRWAPTGALVFTANAGGEENASYLGWGLRGGVRYWLNELCIITGLVEYNHVAWTSKFADNGTFSDDGERWRGGHTVALLSRFELAGRGVDTVFNVPEGSFYALAGPVTAFGSGPKSGLGFRIGIGGQFYIKVASLSLELAYQRIYCEEEMIQGAFFSLSPFAF